MARGLLAILFASFLLAAGSAKAASIVVDATGENSSTDQTFWGIAFESGIGFIESFTIDISESGTGLKEAFFDFDGGLFGDQATEPVYTVVNGISGEITFEGSEFVNGNTGHPSVLTLIFEPESFGAGDSLRFFADTDFLVTDPLPGSLVGQAGVQVRVKLFEQPEMEGLFQTTSTGGEGDGGQSAASFETPAPVPLPAAAWLFLSAIGMLLGWRGLRPGVTG